MVVSVTHVSQASKEYLSDIAPLSLDFFLVAENTNNFHSCKNNQELDLMSHSSNTTSWEIEVGR